MYGRCPLSGREKGLLRKSLHVLRWVPTSCKALYPFWLSAQLDTAEEEAVFPNLPGGLDGLTIAYASDIHYGAFFGRERAADLAERLNALNADLILLGGDYGETAATGAAFFGVIPPLEARLGVYGAMGNHDLIGSGREIAQLEEAAAKSGVRLLRNGAAVIRQGGDSLLLCATDDILKGRPDLGPLLPAMQASPFTIFAPHSPDILPQAEKTAGFRFDLALCGHTHGGQIVLFGHSLHSSSRYGDTYARGWMDVQGGRLMVSCGVGTSLMPIRLGVRPQIHKITLRKAY